MIWAMAAVLPAAAWVAAAAKDWRRRAAIALLLAATLPLYAWLGTPEAGDHPYDPARGAAALRREMQRHADGVTARLRLSPADIEAWKEAGRAYTALKDYSRAEAAFRGGMVLAPEDAALQAGLAEVLVLSAQGTVPEEAVKIFQNILRKEPSAAADYYLGLNGLQAGDIAQARLHWDRLAAIADPKAPWYSAFLESYRRLPAAP